jgi:LPS O-antigen subunit length determinant protein (WzzB/FepE family)
MPDTNKNVKPDPDPTVLTTAQLVMVAKYEREIMQARLDGMDKALALLQAAVDRSPSIAEIYSEFSEKFASVQTQFRERDTRTEQTSKDSKVAVDAALQAAKEAVGEQNKSSALAIAKSETATTKQIDSITTLIQTNQKALDDKIADVKDRITGIEGRSGGMASIGGYLVGGLGLVIAFVTLIAFIIKK